MEMTYSDFDRLADDLLKIENIDPSWLPKEQNLDERIDMQREDDIIFLIWLSLTMKNSDNVMGRHAVMHRLYDALILTE